MSVHDLWSHAEPVNVALAVDLPDDPLVVVVPQRTAELVVAHVPLLLVVSPPDCDCLWLVEPELPLLLVFRPLNEVFVLRI